LNLRLTIFTYIHGYCGFDAVVYEKWPFQEKLLILNDQLEGVGKLPLLNFVNMGDNFSK
jgi:hypothetical protein